MNEYEAHLSSYDHSHKQRLKDMKAMVRDPNAGARARKAEAKAEGLISIKLAGQDADAAAGGGGGLKKGGFRKSGFKTAFAPIEGFAAAGPVAKKPKTTTAPGGLAESRLQPVLGESDTEDEGYDVYDPWFPTD